AGNPQAIGALVRLEGTDGALGPAREVRSGSGLARDEAVQTLGIAGEPAAVHVTWPGGARSSADVPPGASEVRLRAPR
ncbi:MAG: ASPIC/UnbV domain-containing protein, partial [Gemmatimonadota bacterium]|nr:ASPIC/UnbV domain-containing protein [Gemmatimonadota bacterium]